ncbi:hypothetical protein DVS28_b0056 (plasmid) [Euzebya pacifica]|uniref:Uncharacterized protein n=1 Tax=Euzebya pacifica TaxID=1608957 RepID=A0A346Y5S9_9ACTN|nr:hypothetical protein [Euzebya pacifica]AXV09826.1 hypothetical protein DVS28_b0056 [Euzebya pacifica]
MAHPPLIAPLLGRCPHTGCGQPFKATIDLRLDPPATDTVCPWCRRHCRLALLA